MLALCLAVWGALCDNYDASQCAQMNDGGCNCVWVESRQSCTKGDVCGGVGITSWHGMSGRPGGCGRPDLYLSRLERADSRGGLR